MFLAIGGTTFKATLISALTTSLVVLILGFLSALVLVVYYCHRKKSKFNAKAKRVVCVSLLNLSSFKIILRTSMDFSIKFVAYIFSIITITTYFYLPIYI